VPQSGSLAFTVHRLLRHHSSSRLIESFTNTLFGVLRCPRPETKVNVKVCPLKLAEVSFTPSLHKHVCFLRSYITSCLSLPLPRTGLLQLRCRQFSDFVLHETFGLQRERSFCMNSCTHMHQATVQVVQTVLNVLLTVSGFVVFPCMTHDLNLRYMKRCCSGQVFVRMIL